MIFKTLYHTIRFHFIANTWNINNIDKYPLYTLLIHPTKDITGQYDNQKLTDDQIRHDLPFMLANNAQITELNLSQNALGIDTIERLINQLPSTKITKIDISSNPLDDASRNSLPKLLSYNQVQHLNIRNCQLTIYNFNTLIENLKKNTTLKSLIYIDNNATPEQVSEIIVLLKRNNAFHQFHTRFQKEDILDLERCQFDAELIRDLAFYIDNKSKLLTDRSDIKEIKIPNLEKNLTDADLMPLVNALKKNNSIVSLTMDYRKVSAEIEEQIRTQLMLNKARQKLLDKPTDFFSGLFNYAFKALLTAQLVTIIAPVSYFIPILLSAIGLRLLTQIYFSNRLNQAKQRDFSNPVNTTGIARGKQAADSLLAYLNPKCYTPMAYLGYTIEREKLSTKFDVKTECFQPKMKL
jgi:hypothetical protein